MGQEDPERAELLAAALVAIRDAWNEGCPVAGSAEATASTVVRRWLSGPRRNVPAAFDARVEDLTRCLVENLEADPTLVGPLRKDYEYLAERIAQALTGATATNGPA